MNVLKENIATILNKSVDSDYIDSLEKNIEIYLTLLQKWNKAFNLTAINDRDSIVALHILDSLAVLSFIKGSRIIDVGTGAGLPGLVIAMARQDLMVTLLDSNGKKIRFLQEVKRVLQIKNIDIVYSRVMDYHAVENFDTVISRAFSSIKNMQEWSKHLLVTDGIWLAMKGRHPEAELSGITNPYQIYSYKVPGIVGERCCVVLQNIS